MASSKRDRRFSALVIRLTRRPSAPPPAPPLPPFPPLQEKALTLTSPEEAAVRRLSAVETEYDAYTRELQRVITSSVAALALLALYLVTVSASPTSSLHFKPAHISSGTAMGVFGILTAIVLGLQLTTRTPPPIEQELEFSARQKFLALLAFFLTMTCLGLGGYVSVQNLFARGLSDPLASLGPVLGGIVLAFFAADAATAGTRAVNTETVKNAQHVRWVNTLKKRAVTLSTGSIRPTKRQKITDTMVLILVPAAVAVGLEIRFPHGNFLPAVLATVIYVTSCCLVYLVVYSTFVNAVRGTWSFVDPAFVMPVLVFVVYALALLTEITSLSASSNWAARSAGGLLVLLSLTVIPGTTAAIFVGLLGGTKRRGVLRHYALKRAWAQYRRVEAKQRTNAAKAPRNKLAIAALVVSPMFPFGIVLGKVALEQIRGAAAAESPQRGARMATTGIVISWVILTVTVAALVAVIILNPNLS